MVRAAQEIDSAFVRYAAACGLDDRVDLREQRQCLIAMRVYADEQPVGG